MRNGAALVLVTSLTFGFVLPGGALAQDAGGPDPSGYEWAVGPHAYETLGTNAIPLNLGDDELSTSIPVGFTFKYYGSNYTRLFVSSNGFLSFTPGQGDGCCDGQQLPNSGLANAVIAGFWEDLDPTSGGAIRYETRGNSPNRRFILEFSNVPHKGNSSATTTFEIVLFEGRGDFEIRHDASTSDGGMHEVGFQNQIGTDGLSIRHGDVTIGNTTFRVTANATGDGPDASGYAWSRGQYSYESIVNTNQIPLGDDAISTAIPIGFDFTYYGQAYQQVYVSSNGFITFELNQGNGCCSGEASPNPSSPNAIISGFWNDLNPGRGGGVWYHTRGAAPNRRFIVEFAAVPHFDGSAPVTFAIVLFEGRGDFEIRLNDCPSPGGQHATGFENRTGDRGLSIRHGNYSLSDTLFRVTAPSGVAQSGGPDRFGYVWQQSTTAFEDITNTGRVNLSDDAVSGAVPIGFSFIYYGQDYSNVFVSSNGFMSFLANQSHGCCNGTQSPNTAAPNALIAGFWEDLDPSAGGAIWFDTRGTQPNRRFILQYDNVVHSGSGPGAPGSTFQIVLFEGNGNFEIRLQNVQSNGGVHSTGFESQDGTAGLSIRHGNYSLQGATFRVIAPTGGGGPDAFGYRWVPIPFAYEDIENTNELNLGDDQVSDPLPMGFSFQYYGAEYTSVHVSSNGFLTFLPAQNQGCCSGVASPNANDPNAIIAGYWEDLNPNSAGAKVWYDARGSAPNRRFIVQFSAVPHVNTSGSGSNNTASFQIVLYEDGSNFEIRLLDVQSDGETHATGFESHDGQTGLSISYGNYSARNTAYRIIAPEQDAGGPDSFGYRWASTSFAFEDIQNSNGLGLLDDEMTNALPIGFPFSYYGAAYNNVYVSSNGFISFLADQSNACCSVRQQPDGDDPNAIIAGYWGDLDPSAGGRVWYTTLGAAPNRRFIVQFDHVPHRRSTNTASFQIVLFEGPGHFEIRHRSTNSDGTAHATGFEDGDGSGGLAIRHGVYSTQNTAWRVTAPTGASGGPDAFGYRWVVTPFAFEDIDGTNRVSIDDDEMSAPINVGFDFLYYRQPYTRVYASSNGFLSVLAGQSHGCCSGANFPDASNPNGIIAGFWEDLSPPAGGGIWYDTRGTAPDRRFLLQWDEIPHFGSANPVTFQIVLFEGRGDFEIRIATAPSDGGIHSTGFENPNGTIGLPIAFGDYTLSQRAYRVIAPEPNTAGGPYAVAEGATIALDGFCLGCTSYAWDFNADGVFNDGAGPTPQFTAIGIDGLTQVTVRMRGCNPANVCSEHDGMVSVTNANPTITSTPPWTIIGEGQDFRYIAVATDPAGALDPLTWRVTEGPPGMLINSGTGLLTFNGTVGQYPVSIRVSDGDGGEATQSFTLQVASAGPDRFGYTWAEQGASYQTIAATGTPLTLGDDDVQFGVQLGFLFPYYGIDFNQIGVAANGFITFTSGQPDGCCAGQNVPDTDFPNGLIAGYWEDLDPSSGGNVYYQTTGTSPDRVFTLEFDRVPHAGSNNLVSFQILLHEDSGDIEINHIGCFSDGGTHTTGIENQSGTDGLVIGYGDFTSQRRSWYITAPIKGGAGGPYTVDEGGSVRLSGSCNRASCDALLWDFDGDGQYDDAGGPSPTFSAANIDGPRVITVGLYACRQAGDCSQYTATVNVRNVRPTITSTPPTIVGRNRVYSYAPVATDPAGALDPIDWQLLAGPAGMQFDQGVLEWRANTTATSVDVTIRASDSEGGIHSQTWTIQIESRGPDAYGYTWEPTPMTWEDISQTGTRVTLADNAISNAFALPFTFGYYGIPYQEVFIGSNGFITFRSGQHHGCCSAYQHPNTRSPNAQIAAYWEDLSPNAGGTIHYATVGIGNDRRFIVQFTDVPHYRNTRPVTFQIVLYESSDDFEIRVQNAQSDGGRHATGFENYDGRDGLSIRFGDYSLTNEAFRVTAPSNDGAGGPYFVNEGATVQLFGQCAGCTTFDWDFDLDGTFDDATGASPTFAATGMDGPTTQLIDMQGCNVNLDCATFRATVNVLNAAPVITSLAPTTATAGEMYAYQATAMDAAGPADPLLWRLTRAPSGMTIDAATGVVTWSPTVASTTRHRIDMRVTDGDGGTGYQTFYVNVVSRGPDRFGYTWAPGLFFWEDISTSANTVRLSDDNYSPRLPIGFDFRYYGVDYTQLRIGSNGFITFLESQHHGCCHGLPVPLVNSPNGVIAGYWTDLDPRRGGTITWESRGTAPNRRFIVQFTDVALYTGPDTVTFQIVLNEGAGHFEIRHRATTFHTSRYAMTGFENHNGTDGLTILWGLYSTADAAWRVFAPQTPEIDDVSVQVFPQPERAVVTMQSATPVEWTLSIRQANRGDCTQENGFLLSTEQFGAQTTASSTIAALSPGGQYCWYARAANSALPNASVVRNGRFDIPRHPTFTDGPRYELAGLGAVTITATTSVEATARTLISGVTCDFMKSSLLMNGRTVATIPGEFIDRVRLTIEAWIRPTAATQNSDILSAWDGAIRFKMTGGRFVAEILTTQGLDRLTSPTALAVGGWTHVAITKGTTYDQLYINGIRVGRVRWGGNVPYSAQNQGIVLGSENGSGFVGEISSLATYYRELSTSQLQRHATIGPAVDLVPERYRRGAWYFDEPAGVQMIYDVSGEHFAGVRGRTHLAEATDPERLPEWDLTVPMGTGRTFNEHIDGLRQGVFHCYRVIASAGGVIIGAGQSNFRTNADRVPPTVDATPTASGECDGNERATITVPPPMVVDDFDTMPDIDAHLGTADGPIITFPYDFDLGTTLVVWTATDDAGNVGVDTTAVRARDTEPPTAEGGPELVRQATSPDGTAVNARPAVARDTCSDVDLNANAPTLFPLGVTTVTFTVSDSSNNRVQVVRNIRIIDTQGPTFVPALTTLTVAHDGSSCFAFVPPSPPVEDNGYQAGQLTVEAQGEPACWNLGEHEITWVATDPAGNVTTQTQIFRVVVGTVQVAFNGLELNASQVAPGRYYNGPITATFTLSNGTPPYNVQVVPEPDAISNNGNVYRAVYDTEGAYPRILVLVEDAIGGVGSGTLAGFGIDTTLPVIGAPVVPQGGVVLTDPSTYPFVFSGEKLELARLIINDGAWVPEALGTGLAFRDRGSPNHVVTVPSAPSLMFTRALTVEAWIRPGQRDAGTLMMKQTPTSSAAFALTVRDGFVDFEVSAGGRTIIASSENIAAPFAAANEGWHHVAGTYDGRVIRLYLDGLPVHQRNASGDLDLSDGPIVFGPDAFEGSLANVALWNVALDKPALLDHYRGGVGQPIVPTANTVALYTFGGTGQIVADSTGRGNHGFLGRNNAPEPDEPERVELLSPQDLTSSGLASVTARLVRSDGSRTSPLITVTYTPSGTPLVTGPRFAGGLACNAPGGAACNSGERDLDIELIRRWESGQDGSYRLEVTAADTAGNETTKSVAFKTNVYETAIEYVHSRVNSYIDDPLATAAQTELEEAKGDLEVAIAYAQLSRPFDDGSYARADRGILTLFDAADVTDLVLGLPEHLSRAMVADVNRYFETLEPNVATEDEAIFERGLQFLRDAQFAASAKRWAQVGALSRSAFDAVAILYPQYSPMRATGKQVNRTWESQLTRVEQGLTTPGAVRLHSGRIQLLGALMDSTRDVLRDVIYPEIDAALNHPFTNEKRALIEIQDVIDRSSNDPSEQGDLTAVSNPQITAACLDQLAVLTLGDDQFARCYLRLNDMVTTVDDVSSALVHTHRWKAGMALVLFNMLELTMNASPTGLPWVTGTRTPPGVQLVLPDDRLINIGGVVPVSQVDFPDGKLALAYDKYDEAKAFLDNGQVDEAFALFVDERCLLLDLYNRYYSTNRAAANFSDPKEPPIDPASVGCR